MKWLSISISIREQAKTNQHLKAALTELYKCNHHLKREKYQVLDSEGDESISSDTEHEVPDPEVVVSDPEPEVPDSEPEVLDPEVDVSDPEPEIPDPEPEAPDSEPEVSHLEPEITDPEPAVPDISDLKLNWRGSKPTGADLQSEPPGDNICSKPQTIEEEWKEFSNLVK